MQDLTKILAEDPGYRLKQAKQAVFGDLIEHWDGATNLPLALRQKLERDCPLKIKAELFPSKRGDTIKARFTLKDGSKIESVLLKHAGARNTVCVSSQAGCLLGCQFCVTGKLGFKRDLEPLEIVEQVLFFARFLKKENQKITNVVFMGMGEPFLNYGNVMQATKILNDKDGFNLGARHFSISTVGIVGGIEKLAKEKLQINLAISLHAPDDALREKIMPINKKYPLRKILAAVRDYIKETKRRVMFEYVMIKDINDSAEHAEELVDLLKSMPLSFVNLISYSPTGIFKPSSPETIKKFQAVLEKGGLSVTQRYRFGQDVRAACGQLGIC